MSLRILRASGADFVKGARPEFIEGPWEGERWSSVMAPVLKWTDAHQHSL
jgi:hypothetical protein